LKFAYADPPYYGHAKFYAEHHPDALDWDNLDTHRDLIARLVDEFPDGWALSLTSPNLHDILPLCPRAARIGAWTKPFASFKPNVTVAYAWEPFIFMGGRKRTRAEQTVTDFVAANITLRKGLVGAKPRDFCFRIFEILNVKPGDEFVDLFPGTGAVSAALQVYQRQCEMVV
jgi:hypothetical protein